MSLDRQTSMLACIRQLGPWMLTEHQAVTLEGLQAFLERLEAGLDKGPLLL